MALTAAQAKSFYRWTNLVECANNAREAATQSFKAGDLLIIDSSGLVAIAATAGNTVANSVKVIGVALEDASGTTNNPVRVGLISERSRGFMPVMHATPASAVTAYTNNDETFVLKNDADFGWCLLLSTTTNAVARQTGVYADIPVGTQYGIVEVSIPASIDSDVTYSRLSA